MKSGDAWLLVAVLGGLLPLEAMAARGAYETLGEIDCALYFAAMVLNVPLVGWFFKSPRWGIGAICVLGLAIVPYQAYLADRLVRVEGEVIRILEHVYRVRHRNGAFPSDLTGYRFRDARLQRFVQGYEVYRSGDFSILYRVGTVSTSHWFSSRTGWGYYPD